jgi:NAD(P)H dehydrogenase (quinone)
MIAVTVAALLADESHDEQSLVTITGPEGVTLAELARIAAAVTGDPYRYEPLDRAEWIDYRRRLGRPEWAIAAGISYYDGVAAGEAEAVSGDYGALTGRKPQAIAQVIADRIDTMPLTARRA